MMMKQPSVTTAVYLLCKAEQNGTRRISNAAQMNEWIDMGGKD
jgi:hypothetical protein